ncbi:hypothetical protein [Acuticoccus yangtzensis]|uniref:hypothetical protein n=1 Tax=Acuticoccus yangtzensis TaxID=1443441 RepID=UPI000B22CC4B|nr:hypothetical protein [Acuticoccus yangtzensis]
MNRLTYRLALTTAIALVSAAPVAADSERLNLMVTHPGHMSWGTGNGGSDASRRAETGAKPGAPLDLRPGALVRAIAGQVAGQVADRTPGEPRPADAADAADTRTTPSFGVASAAERTAQQAARPRIIGTADSHGLRTELAQLLTDEPPKPKRRDRVQFKPSFNIRARSNRPRYETSEPTGSRGAEGSPLGAAGVRVVPGAGTVPGRVADGPSAARDAVSTAGRSGVGRSGVAGANGTAAPGDAAPGRTVAGRAVPVPPPAPRRATPTATTVAAAAAPAAATVTLDAEAAMLPLRPDVPRLNPRRAQTTAVLPFADALPEVVVIDADAAGTQDQAGSTPVTALAAHNGGSATSTGSASAQEGSADGAQEDRSQAPYRPAAEPYDPADTDAAAAGDTASGAGPSGTGAPHGAGADTNAAADDGAAQHAAAAPGGGSAHLGDEASHRTGAAPSDAHGSTGADAADRASGAASAASPAGTPQDDAGGAGGPPPAAADAGSAHAAEAAAAGSGDDHADGDGDGDGGDEHAESADGESEGEEAPQRVDTTPIPPGPTPFQLVRMMTALQDDIARGSSTALQAQRVLSRRIGERFRASAPREWEDPANGRALVTYGLSGGDPSVVRDVLADAWLTETYMSLAAGALAFMEGRVDDAARHFAAVPDSDIAHSVFGSVRLAQAALAVGKDRAKTMDYLDDARMSAPGTLVEEAALRRAILLAAESDDFPAFQSMVSRYLRKFRGSVYAGNFRRRLASALTHMSFINDPSAIERLAPLFEPMTAGGRQELYLLIARAAIENGSHKAAQTAATRVLDTAGEGSLDYNRAELYRAAAEVVDTGKLEDATKELERLSKAAELPEDDRAILAAALTLSKSVATLPGPAYDDDMAAPMLSGHTSADTAPADVSGADDPLAGALDGTTGGAMSAGGPAGADGGGVVPSTAAAAVSPDEAADPDDPLGPPLDVERRVADAVSSIDALLENSQ